MVTAELERRYGADYDIASWPDPEAALEDLRRLRPADRPVALVLGLPARRRRRRRLPRPRARGRSPLPARRHRPLGRLRDERGRARRAGPRPARPLDAAPRVPGRRGVPSLGHRAARDLGRGAASAATRRCRSSASGGHRAALVELRDRMSRNSVPLRLLRQRRRGRAGGAAGARPHRGDGRAPRHGRAVPSRAGAPPEPDGRGRERRLRRELDGADRPPRRRRHHRRRAGRPGRGRLRRVRGAGHARRRAPGLRRAGGHDVADPQLPGLPLPA